MDIKLFNFLEYNLYVEFTKSFKHIKLIKLESNENIKNKSEYNLDYDFIEFSFSKPKNDIYIYTTKEVKNVILIILEIDGEEVNISKMLINNGISKINENNNIINKINIEEKDISHYRKTVENDKMIKKINEIKNENIFAEIKNENIFAEIKSKNGNNKINKQI